MSDFHLRLVDIALAEATAGFKESGGPNAGAPFERYGLPGEQPLPWCARFVRWCVEKAGGAVPLNRYMAASVAKLEAGFDERGWLCYGPPELADIVFFRSRKASDKGIGRHVGIVVEVASGRIHTVEGNRGDRVARASYVIGDRNIASFGRFPR